MLKRFIQVLILIECAFGTLSRPGIMLIAPASADDAPDATAEATSTTEVEKTERVEVTGSHIKRLSVEGASPVTTMTRKDLEKSGYNSVSDVLRDSTSSSFGSKREESGSNAAGAAHVDLRGLGPSRTLVLLNGQRLPSDAVTGAVDLNMIPMAAVERVEILKDGASAIYGSDALGGVVNIITRKDYSGTEARVTQTAPEAKGGARTEVSLVNGINKEKLNVVNVVQYRDNAAVYARDREWTAVSQSLIGGPGSYRGQSGLWNADPNCPADRVVTTPQGTFCSFNPADYMTKLPELKQFGLMSEGNYELSPNVKLTARLGGNQRHVNWSYAAAPGVFKIPAAVADHLGPGGGPLPGVTPGQDLNVRYRLTELGTRDADVMAYGYNGLVGSTIQMGGDWAMDLSLAHNGVRSSDKGVNGYALTQGLTDAIENGSYNPFAPDGQKGSLEGTRYVPIEKTVTLLSSTEAKATGPLADIGSGQISLAVGTTVTHQEYKDEFDEKSVNGEVFGNAGSSGGGQRSTQSLFSELSVPLTSKLELQVAGRYDHYSDFGDTTNPKGALLFRPVPTLLLRTSVGTGFKAPQMQDMYAATGQGYETFIDASACNKEKAAGGATPSCLPAQYPVTSGGNPGLKEEKSVSYNVGAVFEPSRKFNIGADFFVSKLKNVVDIDYDDVMLAESQGVDLASHGVVVTRDSNGYIDNIVAPKQNLSARTVSGIDLSSAFRPLADIRLSAEHSRLVRFEEEGFPGVGMKSKLGDNKHPQWKNTAAITYSPNDQHDLTLAALTIAGQEKKVKGAGNLPNYTSLDLSYSLKTRTSGTFSVGVKNLLGTTPPLDDSNPVEPLNPEIYDQVGRQFIVGYAKTF